MRKIRILLAATVAMMISGSAMAQIQVVKMNGKSKSRNMVPGKTVLKLEKKDLQKDTVIVIDKNKDIKLHVVKLDSVNQNAIVRKKEDLY